MARKLASIQTISKILPVPNSDNLELALVKGWQSVVRKHQFTEGKKIVFLEIDTWIPYDFYPLPNPSAFTPESHYHGSPLRTVKLRGTLSQGLILPIPYRPANPDYPFPILEDWINLPDGTDLTEPLNLVKFEPHLPTQLAGEVVGLFPSFIPKTDEERIQVLDYTELANQPGPWIVTEKLDGTSMTVFLKADLDGSSIPEFGVCSRNYQLKPNPSNILWQVATKLDLEIKLRESNLYNIAIQGELIGPGIQGNPYKLDSYRFVPFSVFDFDANKRFRFDSFIAILEVLNLKSVPILDSWDKLPDSIDQLLTLADGKSKLNLKTNREGLVIRSTDYQTSFKAISNKFLCQLIRF